MIGVWRTLEALRFLLTCLFGDIKFYKISHINDPFFSNDPTLFKCPFSPEAWFLPWFSFFLFGESYELNVEILDLLLLNLCFLKDVSDLMCYILGEFRNSTFLAWCVDLQCCLLWYCPSHLVSISSQFFIPKNVDWFSNPASPTNESFLLHVTVLFKKSFYSHFSLLFQVKEIWKLEIGKYNR